MMKQSAAVVQFFNEAVESGLPADTANEQTHDFVVSKVQEGLANGTIGWSGDRSNAKAVANYAKAVVGNHFKKQKALNSGVPYRPSFTRGPIDKNPFVKELKENLKSLKAHRPDDMTTIMRVEAEISRLREADKAARKATTVRPIDAALESLAAAGIQI